MKYDVVIIGGGPGGLRCGELLAGHGVKTLILERNNIIGRKVCAGGITWGGLIKTVPDHLIQRTFKQQTIRTRYQKIVVSEKEPMVATVNRIELGTFMADRAETEGAELLRGALVKTIKEDQVEFSMDGRTHTTGYDYLVGADGSNSSVRSYLGIDKIAARHGVGIQYVVGDGGDEMVWNFREDLFSSGYSWIFPHKDCTSVGAYLADGSSSPLQLRRHLDDWLELEGVKLGGADLEAGTININYRGWSFAPRFLVGDAAGLASPLTGEGINPAIVSAETVARTIIDPTFRPENLDGLVKKHHKHKMMLKTAGLAPFISLILSEMCVFLLKYKVINFAKFEMA